MSVTQKSFQMSEEIKLESNVEDDIKELFKQ